jgi:hypothetical protein
MNLLMSLVSWLGAFSIAAMLLGVGCYVAARIRRTVEPLGSPDWLPHDAWVTPTRAVAATVWAMFVVIVVFVGAPAPFLDQLIAAAAIVAIVGATPAEYRVGSVLLSGVIAVLPLVAWLVAVNMIRVEYASHAAGLLAAGLLRGLLGVPDYEYYARAPATAASPARTIRHLVLPDIAELRKSLNARIHGQSAAIIRLTTRLADAKSFFSPVSGSPFVVVAVGPESCGKQRLFTELAKEVHGRFVTPNRRADVQGDALYEGMKAYRINGEPAVVFLDGFESSPKASDLVAQIVLDGHDENDDWSKAMVVIPVTTTEDMPTDEAALLDALAGRIDRKLLQVAAIVVMRPLDGPALGRIAVQMAMDLAMERRVVIDAVTKPAVDALFARRDKALTGARSIQATIKAILARRLEDAVLAGHRSVVVDATPTGDITVLPAPAKA